MNIDRRRFVGAGAGMAAALATSRVHAWTFDPRPAAWRRFELVTTLDLDTKGRAAQAWIPLQGVRDADWVRPLGQSWKTNASTAEVHRQTPYGVEFLHLAWAGSADRATVEVVSSAETKDRRVSVSTPSRAAPLSEDERRLYTAATESIPTDGIVRDMARRIAGDARSDLDKARAVYEWVVENTFRDGATRGCGVGDITAMLKSGYLGGKCADLNALYVGLVRALGVPARDVYEIRVAPSAFGYKSLGANSDLVTKAQHCRSETYVEGIGWVPTDPADVRKVALEEPPGKLPLADEKVDAARRTLFGAWEGNWLPYNVGHDVKLPGSAEARQNFLMYPEAEIAGVRLDCLDPDGFRYTVRAREITA